MTAAADLFGGRLRSVPTGAAAAAVDRTLTEWMRTGHLAGPSHAAARRVLRDAALALDRARVGVESGAVSAYSLAMTARTLSDLLASHGPVAAAADPWGTLLDDPDG